MPRPTNQSGFAQLSRRKAAPAIRSRSSRPDSLRSLTEPQNDELHSKSLHVPANHYIPNTEKDQKYCS